MLIKVSEAVGPVLDWMVAKISGRTFEMSEAFIDYHDDGDMNYSTDWSQGGPIIDLEGITIAFCSGDLGEPRSYWVATTEMQSWQHGYGPYHEQDEERSLCIYKSATIKGPTPLIAAMRCYVSSKVDDEVYVPEELL